MGGFKLVSNKEIGENLSNKSSKGKLVCNKCNGFYELQSGEKPEDFSSECECGGKLKYTGENSRKRKSPVTAAVLNILIAGLGFVYLKKYLYALISFLFVLVTAVLVKFFGIGALLIVVLWSYNEANKYNKNLD